MAGREKAARRYTRHQARRRIERVFDAAVRDMLQPVDIANLLTIVFTGDEERPPALGIICQSLGQINLGWIEHSDAPTGWRAAAYKALGATLGSVLPIFGYDDLFEEISIYYWEGETDDEAARQTLIDMHGADPDDTDELVVPSTMNARRPDWMIAEKAARPSRMPAELREAIAALRTAHKQVKRSLDEQGAWHFDHASICEYDPFYEDCSTLPPLTLVPSEHFARELDDVGRIGMETRFLDLAGLCPLTDPDSIDRWFASLRIGVDLLLAAQALIQLYPSTPGDSDD
ncbi:MAG: hypothetical protein DI537_61795 [Stutzerimonas stutzeri]|nr:MAG: hypothetical protein DI537_61795 [Stutzerimonas stutzeri]